jgi:hypothetical protein
MDVEVNPGPTFQQKKLTMVHMNIQSLFMVSIKSNPRVKLDEIISTFVTDKDVDVLCMSETWLNSQITDKQIEIVGYSEPFRKDRTDRIGGGFVPTCQIILGAKD